MEAIPQKTIQAGSCDAPGKYEHLFGSGTFTMSTDRQATHCVRSSSKCCVWTRALSVKSPLGHVWHILEFEFHPL